MTDPFPMKRNLDPWPMRFTVGYTGEFIVCGGTLEIYEGKVILSPSRFWESMGAKTVTQTDPSITMVTARFLPPSMNTHLIVVGENGRALAGGAKFSQKRWREALSTAGFQINDISTTLGTGRYLRLAKGEVVMRPAAMFFGLLGTLPPAIVGLVLAIEFGSVFPFGLVAIASGFMALTTVLNFIRTR